MLVTMFSKGLISSGIKKSSQCRKGLNYLGQRAINVIVTCIIHFPTAVSHFLLKHRPLLFKALKVLM